MASLWHHGTIAPRAPQKNTYYLIFLFFVLFFGGGGNDPKQILVSRAFKGSMGASAYVGTIGHVYSFAHTDFGAKP